MTPAPYKIAAVHAAPVFLDLQATVKKACDLIGEAARGGAELIVFPETFIAAFPVWCSLRAPIHNHALFCELAASAMRVPGPELAQIADAARQAGVFVSVGFNEGATASSGCIWNANVLIGDDGAVLNHHRKLVPTFYEKLVWAPGDGAGLRVCETRLGRLGMLICGENTNPLARYTLIAQGEQVHMASYPPVWPTHDPDTSGGGGGGTSYSLEEGIKIRGGNHAFEGKLFNIIASAFLDRKSFERLATLDRDAARILDASPRGISAVFGPSGAPVTDFMQDSEGILYAQIDLSRCVELKQLHDISGGYNRFDIFELKVNRQAQRPIRFEPDELDERSAAPLPDADAP